MPLSEEYLELPSSAVIERSESHPLKAHSPTWTTVEGSLTAFSEEHPLNADVPILFRPCGRA